MTQDRQHSKCGIDERIYRRVRREVESDGLRLSLPLFAFVEWDRHAAQRYDRLQIFRGWKRRWCWDSAHPGFVEFRNRTGRNPTDRETVIAAEYLRERLEQEDEHKLYDVNAGDVLRLIDMLRIA